MAFVQSRDSNVISANGLVAAPPEAVFLFLCDLENHWLLADRFVEVLSLDRVEGPANGGKVRVRGPLGLGRTATTRIVTTEPNRCLTGTADLSGGTQGLVSWTLTPERDGTRVELAARLQRAGLIDRILLGLGGRRWIRRRFGSILRTLARRFA